MSFPPSGEYCNTHTHMHTREAAAAELVEASTRRSSRGTVRTGIDSAYCFVCDAVVLREGDRGVLLVADTQTALHASQRFRCRTKQDKAGQSRARHVCVYHRLSEHGPTWLTAGGISAPSMISLMYSTSKFDSPIARVRPSFTAFSIPRQVACRAAAPAGPLLQLL